MLKKKNWITIKIFFISCGVFFLYFISPINLDRKLNYYNYLNLIFIVFAIVFNIIVEFKDKEISLFKVLEKESLLLSVIASVMIIITSGKLDRAQERKIFSLQEEINKESFSRDSISKIFESKNLQLRIELQNKGKELEGERINRLHLEKEISPRVIGQNLFVTLRKYKNLYITIESVDDLEALRLVRDLNNGFKLANWSVKFEKLRDDWINIQDGVNIEVHVAIEKDSLSKEIINAYNELKKILDFSNILSKTVFIGSVEPLYLIKIIVGFKPTPNIFLKPKKLFSDRPPTLMDLRYLTNEVLREYKNLHNYYSIKKDSSYRSFWDIHFWKDTTNFNQIAWFDSTKKWNKEFDLIIEKIEKEENYVYRRDIMEKVRFIVNEYIDNYPAAKKILKDRHFSEEALENLINSYTMFFVIERLLIQFSQI